MLSMRFIDFVIFFLFLQRSWLKTASTEAGIYRFGGASIIISGQLSKRYRPEFIPAKAGAVCLHSGASAVADFSALPFPPPWQTNDTKICCCPQSVKSKDVKSDFSVHGHQLFGMRAKILFFLMI